MAKQAVDAARGTIFRLDPFFPSLTIEGHDTDNTSDTTYDERVRFLNKDDPQMRALIEDVKRCGIRQAILVTKDGESLKVVAGRRRVFAARVAAEETGTIVLVPAMSPTKGTDGDIYRQLITENELRVDDPPSIKAAKCTKMYNYLCGGAEPSKTVWDDLCTIFGGVSLTTIKNYLAFGNLSSKVQKMVDAGDLPATAATQLAQLSREEQAATAEKLVQAQQASGTKVTTERARKARNAATGKGPTSTVVGLKTQRTMLRLVSEDTEAGRTVHVDDLIVQVLRVLAGDLAASRVKGMSELITRAESGLE